MVGEAVGEVVVVVVVVGEVVVEGAAAGGGGVSEVDAASHLTAVRKVAVKCVTGRDRRQAAAAAAEALRSMEELWT